MRNASTSAAQHIPAAFSKTPAAQSLLRRLETGGVLSCQGVSRAAQPFFVALIRHGFPKRPLAVVVEGIKSQERFQQDIETWLRLATAPTDEASPGPALTEYYPPWETLPHEARLPHADVLAERLETLVALDRYRHFPKGNPPLLITSVTALLQRTFDADAISTRTRACRAGEAIDPLDLVEWLESQGYEPESKVTQKGEMSLRGGILDVYPLSSPWPVRLEFFGDEIESIRHFDPHTQVSREPVQQVTIPPAGEIGLLKQESASGANAGPMATLVDHLPGKSLVLLFEPDLLEEHVAQYVRQIPAGDAFHLSWPEAMERLARRGFSQVRVREDADPFQVNEDEKEDACRLELPSLDAFRPLSDRAPDPAVASAQRQSFFTQLHDWSRQGRAVHVVCNNDGEQQRFWEIWAEYGFDDDAPPDDSLIGATGAKSGRSNRKPATHIGALTRGFLSEQAGLVVVTDAEIFGRYKVQRPRRLKSAHAIAARSALDIDFTELEEGDFVVHIEHGIGRYLGLQVLPAVQGRKGSASLNAPPAETGRECLVIEYAPSHADQPAPKLYVPVTEAHLVSKYVGAGKERPALNTLGGGRWTKTKAQAEEAVRDLAGELLAIQAARDSQPGHAFAADTPWQREFEGSFLYEETPDQMRAILESKSDMERARPMDRLICGDVGFGKTEVAIRAAFKSVMEGRQVAVLVPTTVLAQQHFNTFRERMADYPVRVELLSRFRTRRQQQDVIRDLSAGSVDIVIGTHRLIQNDIEFKELGLVIVDEEQRFGVMHKEKFKLLRRLVDVLTLSATPIPRTLHLALTGARDMSTIETPPQDRLPVETVVAPYDERLIRDAIQRELNREGQVYFLHNRVMTIETMAAKLRGLVPEARIIVGHGQMQADTLEEVMTRFVNGEADVLLSTTIIESGLDIPNANTIIIDRADRFGLSDLYQLRGRVGRYKHQAYAYLLIPRHAGLLADARKRISAIKQYSTLGSGFKIAMRDLEIRGAGNLLGPQQSGHITAVGFELYCQLLKQSIASLKGEPVRPRIEVQIRLDFLAMNPAEERTRNAPLRKGGRKDESDLAVTVPREIATYVSDGPEDSDPDPAVRRKPMNRAPAYIPYEYIPEAQQRIEMYRKLAQTDDKDAVATVQREMRDRFGVLPASVELLLQVTELRVLAAEKRVTSIETRDDKLLMTRNNDFIMTAGRFPRLTKRDARAKLNEIRRLLMALRPTGSAGVRSLRAATPRPPRGLQQGISQDPHDVPSSGHDEDSKSR